MKILKLLLLFITCTLVNGQPILAQNQVTEAGSDKYTLLTTPFNKRQLNSYKGQLQFNAGYRFSVNSGYYDSDGSKTVLKDLGTASIGHNYYLDVRYGITDYLEVAASSNYGKSGTKSQTLYYYSSNAAGGVDVVTVYSIDETKGFSDILLTAAARLPFDYKWFDLRISGGYYLPISKFEPPRPSSNVSDITSANTYTINYYNNYTNGFGVPVLQITGTAKATFSKFTLLASYTFQDPVKEGENVRWRQTLVNKVFTFESQPYSYLLNRTTALNTSLHYQAAGWFEINLNMSFFNSSLGWTEYNGVKYKNPDQKLFTIEPGFEIQVSPLVRIHEVVGLPVSGKNSYGPFFICTSFSFNLFPLRKF